jgi:hypothetical protein
LAEFPVPIQEISLIIIEADEFADMLSGKIKKPIGKRSIR